MAGKTKLVIGLVHDKYVHLPIPLVIAKRNKVDPDGSLWRDALDAIEQPTLMVNELEKLKAQLQ
jgi:6-phosphofructokinase 1